MPSREFHELVVHARANPIDPQISLTELRQGFDAMGLSFTPPEDASFEEVSASGVRAEWVRVPESMESAVLLYLHGGGYTMGSTKAYRGFVARLAREGQTRALSIDYRLAPEHPYPATIDDIVKSYKWLLAQHVDPARFELSLRGTRQAADLRRQLCWNYERKASRCRQRRSACRLQQTLLKPASPSLQRQRTTYS